MYPCLIIWYGMGSGTVRKNRLDSVGKTDAQGDAKKKENPVSSLRKRTYGIFIVPGLGLEPRCLAALVFETSASTYSAIQA